MPTRLMNMPKPKGVTWTSAKSTLPRRMGGVSFFGVGTLCFVLFQRNTTQRTTETFVWGPSPKTRQGIPHSKSASACVPPELAGWFSRPKTQYHDSLDFTGLARENNKTNIGKNKHMKPGRSHSSIGDLRTTIGDLLDKYRWASLAMV